MVDLKNHKTVILMGQIYVWVPLGLNNISASLKFPAYLHRNSNFQFAPIGIKIGVYTFLGSLITNMKSDFRNFLALVIGSTEMSKGLDFVVFHRVG